MSDLTSLIQAGLTELSVGIEDRVSIRELERWLEQVLARPLSDSERHQLLVVLEGVSQPEPPTCSGVPDGWIGR